ncbi:hypothetical protein [Sphingobacterium spiritivorum]|uniref:hypothetical protein n=1 Tax=Sphingobacterium spiritivorum TaxID=258 RepID=UPI0037439F88
MPANNFIRINCSYSVNKDRIDSFSNNDVFIRDNEILCIRVVQKLRGFHSRILYSTDYFRKTEGIG